MARATFAAVIGRPASWSQKMVWRYSSSAMVACAVVMRSSLPRHRDRDTLPPMQVGPGTRAFVTGASRGIGRALCEALAARGAIVGAAARSADEVAALAGSLPGTGHH